jgi:cbb3-type cytochrome oxidase maturation protein
MTSPFDGTAFVLMWIGFLVIMSSGIVLFFLWAVRAGQFADQERARHLALTSGIPLAEADPDVRHNESRQPAGEPGPDAGRP